MVNKEEWTEMFRAIGMDDGTMKQWHGVFEQRHPDAHEEFLRLLGIDDTDVARIRAWSAA